MQATRTVARSVAASRKSTPDDAGRRSRFLSIIRQRMRGDYRQSVPLSGIARGPSGRGPGVPSRIMNAIGLLLLAVLAASERTASLSTTLPGGRWAAWGAH